MEEEAGDGLVAEGAFESVVGSLWLSVCKGEECWTEH